MSKTKFKFNLVPAMVSMLVLAVFLAWTTGVAHAAGCDSLQAPGMTDSQIINLKKACLDSQSTTSVAATVADAVSTDNLSQYAELGQKYGIALSEVAKSIGTTVNELAQTPVGVFMLVMVGYKVMGADLLGVIGSVIWFTTMMPLWIYMFHRLILSTRSIKETYGPDSKLTSRVLSPIDWAGNATGLSITMLFVLAAICISGFVMAFN